MYQILHLSLRIRNHVLVVFRISGELEQNSRIIRPNFSRLCLLACTTPKWYSASPIMLSANLR
jgi:hypothetical protein